MDDQMEELARIKSMTLWFKWDCSCSTLLSSSKGKCAIKDLKEEIMEFSEMVYYFLFYFHHSFAINCTKYPEEPFSPPIL